jgi:hypothetical protein
MTILGVRAIEKRCFSRIMSYLVSVRIVNLDTKEEEVLYERQYKRCWFAKQLSYKNYEIQLRWDFKDIQNGEPVLDADIKDKTTGKSLEIRRCPPWHHTEMKYDTQADRKIYDFEFDNLRLRLYIIRTMIKPFSSDAFLEEQKI